MYAIVSLVFVLPTCVNETHITPASTFMWVHGGVAANEAPPGCCRELCVWRWLSCCRERQPPQEGLRASARAVSCLFVQLGFLPGRFIQAPSPALQYGGGLPHSESSGCSSNQWQQSPIYCNKEACYRVVSSLRLGQSRYFSHVSRAFRGAPLLSQMPVLPEMRVQRKRRRRLGPTQLLAMAALAVALAVLDPQSAAAATQQEDTAQAEVAAAVKLDAVSAGGGAP